MTVAERMTSRGQFARRLRPWNEPGTMWAELSTMGGMPGGSFQLHCPGGETDLSVSLLTRWRDESGRCFARRRDLGYSQCLRTWRIKSISKGDPCGPR